MTTKQGIIAKKAGENVPEAKQPKTIKDYIRAFQPQIEKALPAVMTAERFTRIALSAVNNTPLLASCNIESFIGAMMNAAQLGLEPNTPLGQAYLIPFKNNKKGIYECQFQIGYKGLLDLAYRSGEVKTVGAQIVYENDEFDFEYGLEPKLKHKPAKSDRGDPVWVYAMFKLNNGGEGFEVMSIENIREHAKRYSKSYNNGPWQTNFEEMAKKTMIKRVLKYAPLKSEFVKAVAADGTVKTGISKDMSEVPPIDTDYIEIDPQTGEVMEDAENKNDVLPGQMGLEDMITEVNR